MHTSPGTVDKIYPIECRKCGEDCRRDDRNHAIVIEHYNFEWADKSNKLSISDFSYHPPRAFSVV